jgi:hypothetical protein
MTTGATPSPDCVPDHQLGQRTHFVALIEDGLVRVVRRWDLVFGAVGYSEQFFAMAAP